MECGDEDGVGADSVHVDADCTLQIIHVDVATLRDHEDHVHLVTHLKCNKVV